MDNYHAEIKPADRGKMEFSKLLSNLKFKHEMLDEPAHSQSEPIKGSNKTSKKLNNFIASFFLLTLE